ncbi:MAG: flagellar biosynthesis protein FlhF [Chlamydiales bacterium]|nr:flagellar biosynthesis protein FlhF [Chlamydiales bacterium]
MRHLDLILIDTGGRNQYNWQQVDELGEWLHSLDQVEIMLALSATTKDVDAYGILKQFSPLRPKSLVITKTDETIALGSIVNVSSKFGYPISYLSSGSRLEDIQAADRFEIARKLLVLQNAPEYQHLRMLVSA